ncbi:hypothetical protein G6F65_019550 [Rhizopus arrhizus]|nr:hypothetical protein G6F65_019550 [Rhizopus arrhizus]
MAAFSVATTSAGVPLGATTPPQATAFQAADADGAHFAALDQRRSFGGVDEQVVQSAAQQVLDGGRAAVVGDEHHIELGHALEEFAAHVARGADARGAVGQAAGLFAGGALGGWLASHSGAGAVFIGAAILSAIWLAVTWALRPLA